MGYGIKKIQRRSLLLLMPLILLGAFLSVLTVSRSQGYLYYERIEFKYNDTTFHANLYHPTNKIDFQDKHPLVIYIHGFSSQKDMDSRAPLELTKRGFYVATIDMPGHGESANSDLLDTDEDGELVTTQMCSKLLDKIEKLRVYSQIDEDQIGLLGHSYGGYVALMNGLYDDRFTVTVTWSGVADVMRAFKEYEQAGYEIDKDDKDLLHENNPVEVMNNGSKQPDNLFLIVHKEDVWYKYNKRLQDLTNCKWEVFDYSVSGIGEAHLLLHKNVIIKTINWFENKFFDSTSKNGPIQLSSQYNFLLIILTLIASLFTIFSLMIYFSKCLLKEKDQINIQPLPKKHILSKSKTSESSTDSDKKKNMIIFSLSIPVFIGIFILCALFFGFWNSYFLFAPSITILVYLLIFRRILHKKDQDREKKWRLKDYLKSEVSIRTVAYAAFCSALFLGFYFAFALLYPFLLYYPHSILAVILTIMYYFPLYLSTEIFYRKILEPSSRFIKSKKTRTFIISLMTIFIQLFLMVYYLIMLPWPVSIAVSIAFMFSSLMNGIIYHKTEKIGPTLLNTFIIMIIFVGASWSFILNMLSMVS